MSIEDYRTNLQKLAKITFEQAEVDARVKEQFSKGLPNKWRKKALHFDQAKPIAELVAHLAKSMLIDKICPSADHDAAFHAITPQTSKQEEPKV